MLDVKAAHLALLRRREQRADRTAATT